MEEKIAVKHSYLRGLGSEENSVVDFVPKLLKAWPYGCFRNFPLEHAFLM